MQQLIENICLERAKQGKQWWKTKKFTKSLDIRRIINPFSTKDTTKTRVAKQRELHGHLICRKQRLSCSTSKIDGAWCMFKSFRGQSVWITTNSKFKRPRSGHFDRAICLCSHYIFALTIECRCALINLFETAWPIGLHPRLPLRRSGFNPRRPHSLLHHPPPLTPQPSPHSFP